MAKADDPRMKKALEMLHAIEDKHAADAVVGVLNELAPDYARATVAYAFGDTYARTRQLSSPCATGRSPPSPPWPLWVTPCRS